MTRHGPLLNSLMLGMEKVSKWAADRILWGKMESSQPSQVCGINQDFLKEVTFKLDLLSPNVITPAGMSVPKVCKVPHIQKK